MKKLILLLLLFPSILFAQEMARLTQGVGGAVTSGSSCTSGNLAHETFDPTGYDLSWTEVGAGGTINEDLAAPSVTGFSGQALRTYAAGSSIQAQSYWADSGDRDGTYVRFYLYVQSENLADPDTTGKIIYQARTSAAGAISAIKLKKAAGGQLYLSFEARAGVESDQYNISIQTSYCVEIYFNNALDDWEWKINGVSEGSGTSFGPEFDVGRHYLGIYNVGTNTLDIYYDKFDASSSGWLGVCP